MSVNGGLEEGWVNSFPETLIDHPLLSNTFWGEREGLSTSGVLRPVLDLCWQRCAAFETQGKTRTKADEKKRKTPCHNLWKRRKGGRRAKKGEKKERKEIGDRWTKADDKKGRCFMIYEWQKGISLENITEHHWTWEHHEFLKKKKHKTYKPKRSLRQQLDSVICVFLGAITAPTNAIAIIHSRSILQNYFFDKVA